VGISYMCTSPREHELSTLQPRPSCWSVPFLLAIEYDIYQGFSVYVANIQPSTLDIRLRGDVVIFTTCIYYSSYW